MSFRYSYTIPVNGPNKLRRFKEWLSQHAPEIEVSTPPQVPARSQSLTIRLKSAEDRKTLSERLADASL